ncbi:hypothetical protein AOLI_G00259420 [Acnodon oligacanthus]
MASDFYTRCSGITSTLFKEEPLNKDSSLREEKEGERTAANQVGNRRHSGTRKATTSWAAVTEQSLSSTSKGCAGRDFLLPSAAQTDSRRLLLIFCSPF